MGAIPSPYGHHDCRRVTFHGFVRLGRLLTAASFAMTCEPNLEPELAGTGGAGLSAAGVGPRFDRPGACFPACNWKRFPLDPEKQESRPRNPNAPRPTSPLPPLAKTRSRVNASHLSPRPVTLRDHE